MTQAPAHTGRGSTCRCTGPGHTHQQGIMLGHTEVRMCHQQSQSVAAAPENSTKSPDGGSREKTARGQKEGMNFIWYCPVCCFSKGVHFLFKLKISHLCKTALVALIRVFVTRRGPRTPVRSNSPRHPWDSQLASGCDSAPLANRAFHRLALRDEAQ